MSTITITGMRDGRPHTETVEVDDDELARKKAAAVERRAARAAVSAPVSPDVQNLTDILLAKGVLTDADADALKATTM